MKKVIIDLDSPIHSDDGWLLLERQVVNGRTMLCWYSPTVNEISIAIFSLFKQANDMSRKSPESQWGYMTRYVNHIKTTLEATEVANLYLNDMEKNNCWWETLSSH